VVLCGSVCDSKLASVVSSVQLVRLRLRLTPPVQTDEAASRRGIRYSRHGKLEMNATSAPGLYRNFLCPHALKARNRPDTIELDAALSKFEERVVEQDSLADIGEAQHPE